MPALESDLRIGNFYWAGERFQPCVDGMRGCDTVVETLRGPFAFALATDQGGEVCLVRDRLGVNKLFFAIHESGKITVANYLVDLVARGIPCEVVYSVPAGHMLWVDVLRGALTLEPYFRPRVDGAGAPPSVVEMGCRIRAELDVWFTRLAREFASRRVVIALSGGLDSSVVAALARRHFASVTAYTYSYRSEEGALSEDAICAQRLARYLDIPFQLVPASAEEVLGAVGRAVVYGQDWRDFNAHTAIVNELLARRIVRDIGGGESVLVLTGDLMNEFLADYAPVGHGTRVYYPLPKVDRGSLRRVLVQGLDAGDREVGVFGRHGLDLLQPYGLLAETILQVPTELLREEDAKQRLARETAGDLLPDWIFKRGKVRAQIGNFRTVTGILPVLAQAGRDQAWLRQAFREAFRIRDDNFLSGFMRMGIYRSLRTFPTRVDIDGYLTQ